MMAPTQQATSHTALYKGVHRQNTLAYWTRWDQYDKHLTQLANKIALAQKRALQEDHHTWLREEENYTIAEPDPGGSLMSSADNPYLKGT